MSNPSKKPGRRDSLYLIVFILCVMIFAEVSIRLFQAKLSGDIRHINSIESISKNLVQKGGTSILFLGNSLIGDGINSEIVRLDMDNGDSLNFQVGKIVPDGTNLMDWYYIIKNKVLPNNIKPDILVLGYAWNQLADNHEIIAKRLGAHFCKITDLPELYNLGLTDFGKQSEFFLSKASAVFSNSATIRNHVLDMIIPDYRESTQFINQFQKHIAPPKSNVHSEKNSHTRLVHFLNLLEKSKIKVYIIAMPILEPYKIDPTMQALVENYGMYFYDCRNTPGITTDKFVDSMHLGNDGNEIFSHYLATNILLSRLQKSKIL